MPDEYLEKPGLNAMDERLEEAETLIWALLDDYLDGADAARLCKMIEQDATVRARYIDCVQLHIDLQEHFGAKAAEPASQPTGNVQILPDLLPGGLTTDGCPRAID